jgi:hypothetical protein
MTRACSEKRTKSYNYYITLNIWKIQEGQGLVKKPKKSVFAYRTGGIKIE